MRFYTKPHQYYCGIDLHARSMYLCILDQQGEIVFHRNMHTTSEMFLRAIDPYREDIVVAMDEGDALLCAQVSEPVPGKNAFHGHDDIFPVRVYSP